MRTINKKSNSLFCKKKHKTIISLIIFIVVIIYFSILNKKLEKYSLLVLNLSEIRDELTSKDKKEFAFSKCVVDHSFLDMWFPWTFERVIKEHEAKIITCSKELEKEN